MEIKMVSNCEVCEQKQSEKMKMIEYTVDNENYSTETLYECKACFAHWKMIREDSYHQPIVTWKAINP